MVLSVMVELIEGLFIGMLFIVMSSVVWLLIMVVNVMIVLLKVDVGSWMRNIVYWDCSISCWVMMLLW